MRLISPKRLIPLALAVLTALPLAAQKKPITLSDAVLKQRSTLGPERIRQLQWIPDKAVYAFLKRESEETWLMEGDPAAGTQKQVLSLSQLNEKLPAENRLAGFPRIRWRNAGEFSFMHKQALYLYDLNGANLTRITQYTPDAAGHDLEPKQMSLAYTRGENLYISRGDMVMAVTEDGKDGLVNGQAVHRFEFGIRKGTFWSPEGNYLAYYRKDESMVSNYPLVDLSSKPASLNNIRYPMAGMPSHHVQVGIYSLDQLSTVFLKTGEPLDQYLTNIAWSPNEEHIYVVHLNRDQNHLHLKQYDARTGELQKTILEERGEAYVEPEHPMIFLKDRPDEFLWFSERDGFQHLYHYKIDGTLIRQLTSGNWEVTDFLGTDENGTHILLAGTGGNATERHIYRVNLSNGKRQQLTKEAGMHRGILHPDGHHLIQHFSSVTVPHRVTATTSAGKQVGILLEAANPLEEYAIGTTELLTIKAKDGTPLHARMIKPHDFDPQRKYPVLVYVYGGPHAQLVLNTWLGGAPMWMHHMANRGYLIFTVDNRGSAHRGLAFEQATFRNLGQLEMQDQLDGVAYLKGLDYVDPNRLAVHGWSYGGFMTTSLLLNYPGTFKAGVAGGPVIDWKFYEVMYTERYMDTPETNPEGFAKTSLLDKADALTDNLLMIHGTVDDVVVWQHSQAFVKSCVDKGVQLDYFLYPGHPHNVRGKDRVHLMQKVLDYVEDHL